MKDRITTVVGFTRCGTSLMMRLLDAHGIEAFCEERASFEAPNSVHRLPVYWQWLKNLEGKCVKILEPQRWTPPPGLPYDFIWMQRDPYQQACSQLKFLKMAAGFSIRDDEDTRSRMAMGIMSDTPVVKQLLRNYDKARFHQVHFEELISTPMPVMEKVFEFVGVPMDADKVKSIIIPRNTDNYDGFLEPELKRAAETV